MRSRLIASTLPGMNKNILFVLMGIAVLAAFGAGYAVNHKKNTSQPASQTSSELASSGKTLDLSGKQLTTLSDAVTSQTDVTSLNLSNNQLATLPASIAKMKNLQVLNVENNRLESLPAEIGHLTKLQTVDFSNNRLTSLPPELGNLPQLKSLNLNNYKGAQGDIDQLKTKLPNTDIKM